MSKLMTAAAIGASLVGTALASYAIGRQDEGVVIPVPVYEVQEDEPGWDCRIHGNKVCGEGVR